MAIEVNGKIIVLNEIGYLENPNDWDPDVALKLAEIEGIELTNQHWDVINYLRNEYLNNGQNQPMERVVLKEMAKLWGTKATSKDLYQLFPLAPTKQGMKIAGLPAVKRKGGY